ncbi:hypothetical protein F511_26266 [Dorcoceras hygrometricum]|uniref:Uncharacterized protein n=1 Tax=Dorcoceras hygrometricum TaxID=472368 RepID=A0A2Z7BW04_9LAMI|nr:hypothetical protein F511_26266 [Dorcoceras hygrometricum]
MLDVLCTLSISDVPARASPHCSNVDIFNCSILTVPSLFQYGCIFVFLIKCIAHRKCNGAPSLPKIAHADKGKKVLVEKAKGNPVKETIALIFENLEFFIKIRDSVFIRVRDDLQLSRFEQPKWIRYRSKADMAKLFRWTETDSIRVAFKHRLMVHAKLRELFLQKVLHERRKNFFPRHPLADKDLQVLDELAEAHRIAVVRVDAQLANLWRVGL